jgi:hypothetical protein
MWMWMWLWAIACCSASTAARVSDPAGGRAGAAISQQPAAPPPVIPAPHPLAFAAADVEVPDGEICFVAQKSILAKLS